MQSSQDSQPVARHRTARRISFRRVPCLQSGAADPPLIPPWIRHEGSARMTDAAARSWRKDRLLLLGERGAFVLGVLAVSVCGLSFVRSSLCQSLAGRAFDRVLSEKISPAGEPIGTGASRISRRIPRSMHPDTEWPPEGGFLGFLTGGHAPIGRLQIPSIGLSVMILEGTEESILDAAVGHIEGTSLPGEGGNVG